MIGIEGSMQFCFELRTFWPPPPLDYYYYYYYFAGSRVVPNENREEEGQKNSGKRKTRKIMQDAKTDK